MVEHIPLIPADGSTPRADPPYLLRFDDGTATERKYKYLSKAILPSVTTSSTLPHDDIGLSTLLQDGSKSTMEINGVFQKGYISRYADNAYRFSVRRVPRSPTELWRAPLHAF